MTEGSIKLNDQQYQDALAYAADKYECSRAGGFSPWTYTSETILSVNDRGMIAEWAAALILGLDPHKVLFTKTKDPGYDFLYHGAKVDVKSTKYDTGILILNTKDMAKSWEFVVLVIGGGRYYRLTGYMSHEEMAARGTALKKGAWQPGKGCTATQEELHPWENLSAACARLSQLRTYAS